METPFTGTRLSPARRWPTLPGVARWTAAVLLAWAAGGKLVMSTAFGQMLTALGLLPDSAMPAVRHGLPVAELALALFLAMRIAPVLSAFALLFLSLLFAGVHGYVLVSGEAVPCGCLGVSISHASWLRHVELLAICLAMAGCAVTLLFIPPAPGGRPAAPAGGP
ncbi:MAG TPA: MauE/DoxX family redox-associated membrane protein [Phycisphaerae bacterium]|nr:MauE/DoxX family redox-associated membrane protein [Phycisphaerae bacterium]